MIAGEPSRESDRALSGAFAAFLERHYPGTCWSVERVKPGLAAEPSAT
jgi:hypothetical protein